MLHSKTGGSAVVLMPVHSLTEMLSSQYVKTYSLIFLFARNETLSVHVDFSFRFGNKGVYLYVCISRQLKLPCAAWSSVKLLSAVLA